MAASGRALADVLATLCRFVEDTASDCISGAYLIDWGVPAFVHGPEFCLCGMAAL